MRRHLLLALLAISGLFSCAVGAEDTNATNDSPGYSAGSDGQAPWPAVDASLDSKTSADAKSDAEDASSDPIKDQSLDQLADQTVDQAVDQHADQLVDAPTGFCVGKPKGTVCSSGDACFNDSVCESQACVKKPKPNGTLCDPAKSACYDHGTCQAGICEASMPKPNGTVCASASNSCHKDSTCQSGQCVEQKKPNGTVCNSAPDSCHTAAVCSGGACGAIGERPDGYNWDSSDPFARCCDGKPVRTTTNDHCNVCGIKCNPANGESCQRYAKNGQYYCTGCVASKDCWSKCCSNTMSPPACGASDCNVGACVNCPPGTSCHSYKDASGNFYASNACTY